MKILEKKTKKGEAKVAIKNGAAIITFVDDGEVFRIDPAPQGMVRGHYRISLNSDLDDVSSATPWLGVMRCRFVRFFKRSNDQYPSPTSKTNEYGTYLQFSATLEVVDGEFSGLEFPVYLRYQFAPDDDGSGNIAVTPKGGKKSAKFLADFLDAIGLGEVPIKFSDNVLPEIERRAKKVAKTFKVATANGYVSSISDADEYDSDEDDDEVDEIPWKDEKVKSKKLQEEVLDEDDED